MHRAGQTGANGMQLILEGGHDPEVPAAAPHAPEQVRMRGGTGREELAVGGDDIDGEEIITDETVLPREPAQAAAQGEARDTGVGDGATGRRQAERLGFVVELAPGDSALRAGRAPDGIDPHAPHPGQVDHQTVVADGIAGNVMATAAYRQQQMMGAGELDTLEDIGHTSTADNQCRASVNHGIPDLASLLVARLTGTEQGTTQAGLKPCTVAS